MKSDSRKQRRQTGIALRSKWIHQMTQTNYFSLQLNARRYKKLFKLWEANRKVFTITSHERFLWFSNHIATELLPFLTTFLSKLYVKFGFDMKTVVVSLFFYFFHAIDGIFKTFQPSKTSEFTINCNKKLNIASLIQHALTPLSFHSNWRWHFMQY